MKHLLAHQYTNLDVNKPAYSVRILRISTLSNQSTSIILN